MTDLDRIRGELKRIPCYDPSKPIARDLSEQVMNDLAVEWGVDACYVLELFEQIATDAGKATIEQILQSLFQALAPYQNGSATRPAPIEYVAARFPDNTVEATRRDQIREMAIQECGWPIGTVATIQGQRFELTYAPRGSGRSAYVLWQPGGTFLIPRYNEALSRHIEKRDRAFGVDEEGDEELFPPWPGMPRNAIAKALRKRGLMIIVDDVAPSGLGAAAKRAAALLERVAKTARDYYVGLDLAKPDPEDWLKPVQKPLAAPTSQPKPLGLPGHARNPEGRSRGPPVAA